MQKENKYKIYSINTSANPTGCVEIETVILNGLYRFSILGINQKNSSDIKDRVYSALRSQKLINLKSDNKKITVNLLPTTVDKKSNIYDLGIALGCLVHMDQIKMPGDIFVIGELSITGKIIPSEYILKSIHQATEAGVEIIICSNRDVEMIDNYQNNMKDLISDSKIKFIAADNLNDLVNHINNKNFYEFKNKETEVPNGNMGTYVDIQDVDIFKILLAICTKRNIFIENKKDSYIKKYIRNLMYYSSRLSGGEILLSANILNKTDLEILEKHVNPLISLIDSQTQKDGLHNLLNESMFGFNIVDDFTSIPEDTWHAVKKNHKSTIVSFYNSCPCGNSNNLFNSFEDDKCICLQRSILRHRQKLHRLENNFFDFYIKDVNYNNLEYGPSEYIHMGNIISQFRNTDVVASPSEELAKYVDELSNNYEKAELNLITELASDIAKLEYLMRKTKKPMLTKVNIDFAAELLKKGF